jgi:large repetitive protein
MRTAIATAITLALLVTSLAVAPVLAVVPIVGNDQAATPEDTQVTIDLLANDSDPDGGWVSIESVDDPPNGSVEATPVGGSILYTPDRDYNSSDGPDRFQYTLIDEQGETATGLVTVFVAAVNDPPLAEDRFYTVPEDGSIEVLFLGMDPDKERCDLTFQVEHHTAFGTVGPLTDAGCVEGQGDHARAIYAPFPGYNGRDSIQYGVHDGTVGSSAGIISITVTPVEDAPVALAASASTTGTTPVAITIRGFDWETCELTFATAAAGHGTVSAPVNAPCGPGGPVDQNVDAATVTYTAAAGFAGSDSFTFTVNDGTATSAPATVSIQVAAPPTLHSGDLDATAAKLKNTWTAAVTIAAHDSTHGLASGVTVRGSWSTGQTGSCVTSAAGRCTLTSPQLARKVGSITFTVTTVVGTGRSYNASLNHDPDGDSNGSSIVVTRP